MHLKYNNIMYSKMDFIVQKKELNKNHMNGQGLSTVVE